MQQVDGSVSDTIESIPSQSLRRQKALNLLKRYCYMISPRY